MHDYRAILQKAPDLYLICTPDLVIIEASDNYLNATMTTRESILGRELFNVFPANPNEPCETGTKNLKRSLMNVIENKVPDKMHIQKYDIRSSEDGEFVERYWSPLNTPVLSNNELKYIIRRVEDVTEVVNLKKKEIEQTQQMQLLLEN